MLSPLIFLAIFEYQNIPFAKEVSIPVYYREEKLDTSYRADFICYDNIIVELKALKQITKKEESQVINYLKATKFKKSLILNFGGRSLEYKRLIYTL